MVKIINKTTEEMQAFLGTSDHIESLCFEFREEDIKININGKELLMSKGDLQEFLEAEKEITAISVHIPSDQVNNNFIINFEELE